MITAEKLVAMASYFTTIHHVQGRLRVRVSSKIKQENENVTLKDIEAIPEKIVGIKKLKINKIVGSITIEYDHAIFKKELWDDLIAGENPDTLIPLLHSLYKEVA